MPWTALLVPKDMGTVLKELKNEWKAVGVGDKLFLFERAI